MYDNNIFHYSSEYFLNKFYESKSNNKFKKKRYINNDDNFICCHNIKINLPKINHKYVYIKSLDLI